MCKYTQKYIKTAACAIFTISCILLMTGGILAAPFSCPSNYYCGDYLQITGIITSNEILNNTCSICLQSSCLKCPCLGYRYFACYSIDILLKYNNTVCDLTVVSDNPDITNVRVLANTIYSIGMEHITYLLNNNTCADTIRLRSSYDSIYPGLIIVLIGSGLLVLSLVLCLLCCVGATRYTNDDTTITA
jgi:hypothetical protein